MTQNGIEVVFEVSTYCSDEGALTRTLCAVLESQLDAYNCCPGCFTFEPPFEQKTSGTHYQGVVTTRIQNTVSRPPGIPWSEYVQAQSPLTLVSIQAGSHEV